MESDTALFFSPAGVVFVILMGVLTFLLPRRVASLPILMTGCYITLGQGILVASLHFSAMRIIILAGWLRVVCRKELSLKLNAIDKILLLFVISNIFTNTILVGTQEAFINRLGFAYDIIGIYFLFRFLIKTVEEIEQVVVIIAIIVVPLAILMFNEQFTGRNFFSLFGGVSEYTVMRDDKFRCQGPFTHPILAGTFGATIMPLFLSLGFKGGTAKLFGIIGVVAATAITLLSVSSGPVIAYFCGVVGLCMWPLRRQMRLVRYLVLFVLIALHMVMKAPVWHIMARLADIIGGHGWYRAAVIDAAIEHFSEWWLIGTTYTANWGLTVLPNNPNKVDMTNQYIHVGIDGGMITMSLFIAMIVTAFSALGVAREAIDTETFQLKFFLWSMGAALFAHVMNFFSVSYFDQIVVFWYLLLAIISVAADLYTNYSEEAQMPTYS